MIKLYNWAGSPVFVFSEQEALEMIREWDMTRNNFEGARRRQAFKLEYGYAVKDINHVQHS